VLQQWTGRREPQDRDEVLMAMVLDQVVVWYGHGLLERPAASRMWRFRLMTCL
jgi:hypothetical protein